MEWKILGPLRLHQSLFTAYFNVHLDSPEKFVPPLVPLLVIIIRLSCVKTSRTEFEFDLVCHD